MISDQAKHSIAEIFEQAARTRLPATAGDSCEITAVPKWSADNPAQPCAMALTISSIAFRLLFVLHFGKDEATRAYYAGGDANRSLAQTLMELGNLCCGYMNQQLVKYFPDLGMSTPYELNSTCVEHLDELRPDHVWTYELVIGAAARLGVTLCVCAQAPLDFKADVGAADQSEGELELF
ncbi:hypothetical protein LJ656_02500 [Paraburkholderia sp. MMS20-SJTR3]|uniref:Chemotaxis protein CheX n=1 Tax=Paraburkholderia sejongensis TaxID=2886946 RepID=A0ABS8JNH4_9BURK|nr:hypothetical protein [Paraburkholderia sp. MMS20-SJTR3]MCC8391444.1 hypothetical protein [Paraburkholderia sp. MMS20-SJTR3]